MPRSHHLLLLLTLAAGVAHAQRVTLSVCNPGTADVDVYFAQGANLVSKHVAPADCATLAQSKGSMTPGLVAVAFANSRGQWGGAHRSEGPPRFGTEVAHRTTQTISVARGADRVSLPAQFSFTPPAPLCVQRSHEEPLPGGGIVTRSSTACDDFDYAFSVLAFGDTREVAFLRFCEPCERKRGASGGGSREENEDRYRESEQWDPAAWDRIGWSDVKRYAFEAFRNEEMMGSAVVVQGTIAGVKLPNPGAEHLWTDVYFREAPDHALILCATGPDILADVFGADFATSMIGKTVEVGGILTHCLTGPGIIIDLQHRLKLVGTAPGMVPAVTPPRFKFPGDDNAIASPAPAAPVAPTPPPRQFDRLTPYYDPDVVGAIDLFCQMTYDPAVTREPFLTAKKTHAQEIAAEIARCKAKLNEDDLRRNRQATLHYCVTHFDYFTQGRQPYETCFKQNDELLAMCTRGVLSANGIGATLPSTVPRGLAPPEKWTTAASVGECAVPYPSPAEIARVKQGGNSNGPELPVPAKGPGIRPNFLGDLEPGIVHGAGAPAAAPK